MESGKYRFPSRQQCALLKLRVPLLKKGKMNVEGQVARLSTLIKLHGADYKCNMELQKVLFHDGNGKFSGEAGQG